MARRLTSPARHRAVAGLWWCAAAFCGSFVAGAVVVSKPTNDSSLVNRANGVGRPPQRDGLETSQSRGVDQVNLRGLSDRDYKGSAEMRNKDYGDGEDGGYTPTTRNTYGPPKDYYYDEPSEYQFDGHHQIHGAERPANAIYHQQKYPSVHHSEHVQPHYYQNHYDGGYDDHRQHRPGELNIQPLLLPLAGITLLGVLSALVKTPLLLHLGNVGRRRRRDAVVDRPRDAITADTITSLLNEFDDNNGQRLQQFNPHSCLVCDVVASIYDQKSFCVERSVCEVTSRNEADGVITDKRLLTAIIERVVKSNEVPEEFKKRLETAVTSGRIGGNCGKLYPCGDKAAAETVNN